MEGVSSCQEVSCHEQASHHGGEIRFYFLFLSASNFFCFQTLYPFPFRTWSETVTK